MIQVEFYVTSSNSPPCCIDDGQPQWGREEGQQHRVGYVWIATPDFVGSRTLLCCLTERVWMRAQKKEPWIKVNLGPGEQEWILVWFLFTWVKSNFDSWLLFLSSHPNSFHQAMQEGARTDKIMCCALEASHNPTLWSTADRPRR